ncbi:MGH1-like glycoside hydrolase domain-containing protein [Pararhizobium mangrovi]|uniref:Glycoside hydrolase family 37 n=1 Tax=Pararhizobium mangrovi TaxID=2590452 RepID=A0A506TYM1_9HYPH|nr:trehalase family glycosidase [Pararhizobium mangrovi]TPW25824.1 glycoside hydrolase family 37 [Pararhizobium mangrovi]
MPAHVTIPLDRAWNSWTDRPAELTFLPLGVHVTPVLYSTRAGATSLIEPRRGGVRFGTHSIDNRHHSLDCDFAGTSLTFEAGTNDPFAIAGRWQASTLGEWGARFWLMLAFHGPDGTTARFDPPSGAVLIEIAGRTVALVSKDPAILVSGHETLDALREELVASGYFYVGSRSTASPLLALRFNLEMMREGAYGAAVADTPDLAIAKARSQLEAMAAPLAPAHEGASSGALDAMRDVVGWNTVWDTANHRPYTRVTRIWNLGDFAVWYNDQTYAALLSGAFDTNLARENMAAAHAGVTPQGNVACIVTSNGAWVDRSQPPLGSLTARQLYLRTRERSLLEAHYTALARNQRWWRRERDPEGSGLVSCGTSDVGEALYKGTPFGARNETGMDNSATHDEAVYDRETRSLSTWDLGLNCAVALDAEMLSLIAGELGHAGDAREFAAFAERSRTLISEELWDPERRIFANRQRNGAFVRSLSPTSFYPLACGAATLKQADDLLGHLSDPKTFHTPFPLPNATRDDPAYAENVYWRGRIWPNVNFIVWLGLRRYGLDGEAGTLAAKSYDLFMRSWKTDRVAAENYNAETGEALDQGDTDPFYIWSALLPMMAVEEICGFDPWHGWTLTNGPDTRLGPLQTPIGPAYLERRNGALRLSRDDTNEFSTTIAGRLRDVRFFEGGFSCTVPPTEREGSIVFHRILPEQVIAASLGSQALAAGADGLNGTRMIVPAGTEARRLGIWFDRAVDTEDARIDNIRPAQ